MTRTVAIVGGAGAVGRALAASYRADGFEVHLLDKSLETVELAASLGATATVVDVTQGELAAALAPIPRLDALVNAVGMWPTVGLDELDPPRWDELVALNLNPAYHAVWGCRDALRAARGSIVNLTSAIAFKGHPRMAHYAAAKAGVIGMTRSLALALGPDGVRVNAVAPGLIDTEANAAVWTPEQRAQFRASRALPIDLSVADVVATVRFLTSPGARAITGQTIVVDGGTVLH